MYPQLTNREVARAATLTDPALLTVLGEPFYRVLPGRSLRFQVQNDTVTGGTPSLTVRLEESADLSTWTTLSDAVVNANGQIIKNVVAPAQRWVRVVVGAKSGTTPGVTGLHVNLLLGSG